MVKLDASLDPLSAPLIECVGFGVILKIKNSYRLGLLNTSCVLNILKPMCLGSLNCFAVDKLVILATYNFLKFYYIGDI